LVNVVVIHSHQVMSLG